MLNKQTATAFGAGMAAMLGLMLALGATPTTSPSAPPEVGRFQVFPAFGGASYMVDTATGQSWHSNALGFSEPKVK